MSTRTTLVLVAAAMMMTGCSASPGDGDVDIPESNDIAQQEGSLTVLEQTADMFSANFLLGSAQIQAVFVKRDDVYGGTITVNDKKIAIAAHSKNKTTKVVPMTDFFLTQEEHDAMNSLRRQLADAVDTATWNPGHVAERSCDILLMVPANVKFPVPPEADLIPTEGTRGWFDWLCPICWILEETIGDGSIQCRQVGTTIATYWSDHGVYSTTWPTSLAANVNLVAGNGILSPNRRWNLKIDGKNLVVRTRQDNGSSSSTKEHITKIWTPSLTSGTETRVRLVSTTGELRMESKVGGVWTYDKTIWTSSGKTAIQVGNAGELYAMNGSTKITKLSAVYTDSDAKSHANALVNTSIDNRQLAMVVGSNWGTHPFNGHSYDCQGRCGNGCGPQTYGTQDCLQHDACSYFNNSTAGKKSYSCGGEFHDAVDDTMGAWDECPGYNGNFDTNAYKWAKTNTEKTNLVNQGYRYCTQIKEGCEASGEGWGDNWFCSKYDFGMVWSQSGTVSGKRCTQVKEAMDPDCWTDNYLCVNSSSVVLFEFVTSVGAKNNRVAAGMICVQWSEPNDLDTWNDNYMCYHPQLW